MSPVEHPDAHRQARAEEVFLLWRLSRPAPEPEPGTWEEMPPTAGQQRRLAAGGIVAASVLNRRLAVDILLLAVRRRRRGLAGFRQLRALDLAGVACQPATLTATAADEMLTRFWMTFALGLPPALSPGATLPVTVSKIQSDPPVAKRENRLPVVFVTANPGR